jgi:Flp pilus assembly protein TadD
VTWGPPAPAVADLTHLRRAVVLQAKGEHEAAILEFSKAIAVDPNCIEGYAGRGISKEALGDVDGARRDYCKSVEVEVKQGIARHLASAPDLAM